MGHAPGVRRLDCCQRGRHPGGRPRLARSSSWQYTHYSTIKASCSIDLQARVGLSCQYRGCVLHCRSPPQSVLIDRAEGSTPRRQAKATPDGSQQETPAALPLPLPPPPSPSPAPVLVAAVMAMADLLLFLFGHVVALVPLDPRVAHRVLPPLADHASGVRDER
jgi:hypothetical protein